LESLEVIDAFGAVVADSVSGGIYPTVIKTIQWAAGECINSTATWQLNSGPFHEGRLPLDPRVAPGGYRLRVGWRGAEDGARFNYTWVYSDAFRLD